MKNLSRSLAAFVVASLFVATAAHATAEMAKKEGLKCTVCHDKAGSKLLTDKGKYYELKGTLADYDLLIRVYKKCTACHSRESGNKSLTPKGEALKAKGVAMDHFGTTEPKK